MYGKLVVANVNNNSIGTNGFVLKIKYDTGKSDSENKIPDTSGLIKKTDYSSKISKMESKIPSINGLATTSALTAVGSKITDISSLAKHIIIKKIMKLNRRLSYHNHEKCITIPEFNKYTAEDFDARLAWVNLIRKTDFHKKLIHLNRNINSNKTKHALVENELKRLQTFDSVYIIGRNYFEEDFTQNYLVFQPMNKYFKKVSNNNHTLEWRS